MTNENKTIAIAAIGICAFIAIPIVAHQVSAKRNADVELKKAELEAGYPPEYWQAKKAEAEAKAEVKKAKIESDERLELDRRERHQVEIADKRAFEKNAPAEYWEQKKIEAEEQTKRELNMQRYNAEQEMARQHNELLQKGFTATARALRQQANDNYGFNI